MHGDVRTSQPTARQRPSKKEDIPLFCRQCCRPEETFIYSDFGTSSEKDGSASRDDPEEKL